MLQLWIIIVYFAVMVFLGILSRKQISNKTDFFVAGRKGSTFLITGSLFATIIGGSATVGVAGLGFTRGLTGAWWLWVGSIGLLVLGFLFAGKVRKFALYTLPDLVEKKYGRTVGVTTSILIVIAWFGVIAGQIVATGKILGALDMGTPELWMAVFTVVTVFYTVIGGQFADLKTDIVQGVVIFGGIFAGVIALMSQMGGINGFIDAIPAAKLTLPVGPQFGWYDLMALLFLVGATYVAGPDMFSRVFSAKDEKTAKRSVIITALLVAVFALGPVVIGMGMSVLRPDITGEQAFPVMASSLLHPALGGLVLAGLLAATMSSADSCILSASTILTNNVIQKFKAGINEKQALTISRWGVVVIGAVSLGLALYLKGIINSLLFAYTVFTAGVIPLVIAGFYKEKLRVTSLGAMFAVIGGGGTALYAKLNAVKYLDLGALGISVVLLFGVSLLQNALAKKAPGRLS